MSKSTTPSVDFQTEPTLFELEPVSGKKVTLDFSAPLLSSVGGLTLVGEYEMKGGIIDSQFFTNHRNEKHLTRRSAPQTFVSWSGV